MSSKSGASETEKDKTDAQVAAQIRLAEGGSQHALSEVYTDLSTMKGGFSSQNEHQLNSYLQSHGFQGLEITGLEPNSTGQSGRIQIGDSGKTSSADGQQHLSNYVEANSTKPDDGTGSNPYQNVRNSEYGQISSEIANSAGGTNPQAMSGVLNDLQALYANELSAAKGNQTTAQTYFDRDLAQLNPTLQQDGVQITGITGTGKNARIEANYLGSALTPGGTQGTHLSTALQQAGSDASTINQIATGSAIQTGAGYWSIAQTLLGPNATAQQVAELYPYLQNLNGDQNLYAGGAPLLNSSNFQQFWSSLPTDLQQAVQQANPAGSETTAS